MPVCVVGMHRSGTSMVTKLLHLCGVYLGPESELIPATPDNQDGHWEHRVFQEINDEILSRFGGGWDFPPELPADWLRSPALHQVRAKASRLIAQFEDRDPWGWKDPRTSLTFPFWAELIPQIKVIICVRNPLEVALSLRRRGLCSYALGLNLWQTYNARALGAASRENRIVTHYASYFGDQGDELRRALDYLGHPVSNEALEECRQTTKQDLRHNRFETRHLYEVGVSSDVIAIYRSLCEEARYPDENTKRSHAPHQAATENLQFDINALEAELLRREVERFRRTIRDRDAVIDELRAKHEQTPAAESVSSNARAYESLFEDLQRHLTALREEIFQLRGEQERLRESVDVGQRENALFRALLEKFQEESTRRAEDLGESLHQLRAAAGATLPRESPSPQKLAYRQLVRRVRSLLKKHVPGNATVLVIAKGDEVLVRLPERRGWHFPQNERGDYAGYYPACGPAAIAHLEVLRARGAQYLMIPSPSAWWLDTYPEFKTHLETRYRVVTRKEGVGALYCLAAPRIEQTSDGTFAQIVAQFRSAFGHDPSVLDWTSGQQLSTQHPDLPVFAPPSANGPLPYVDQSVDLVAVASHNPEVVSEARRVATTVVIDFSVGKNGRPGPPIVSWLRDVPVRPSPTVSIIIPVFNHWTHTAACLRALQETLPREFRGEVLIVDDASTDETPARLAEIAEGDPRVRVLRNEANQGFLDTCNRGAEAAEGEFLIFLNNDTIPLPDWLPPLLQTFEQFPDAGAVGGKLLFPDGRLQEAGGILFRDASAAHFGRGEADAAKALFNYVREVDYCSGALLATPRALFRELGGFDIAYQPGYYEDTDYCFRIRSTGRQVYYQPESVIVHLEGTTSGNDLSSGMKQYQAINRLRFLERWREVLEATHTDRPAQFEQETWYALAHCNREHAER